MIRTRMAPSPTGEYHIGHIRTVLYNIALAKKSDGKFILRIEDTDRIRFVDGATDRILDVILDYGLNWDEGPRVDGPYGPYIQSERLDLYKQCALDLVSRGQAYYCFCDKERLEKLREDQTKHGIPPKYDKHCLSLSQTVVEEKLADNSPYVIRLNIPEDTVISFDDAVYGSISFNSSEVDDQVLLKSDGFPTYHLAVVVDDHLMGITHILRGNDWLPSTPKHVLLYQAFGWDMPVHVHLPNLKEKDGSKKLSKRFGAVFARQFLEEGYLPEALLNFLMFLGWNPGNDREIYSLQEFIAEFSIDRVHKTDLVAFDRDKLLWFNGHYIRNMKHELLLDKVMSYLEKYMPLEFAKLKDISQDKILAMLGLVFERMHKLNEFPALVSYFISQPSVDKNLLVKYGGEKVSEIVRSFLAVYENLSPEEWSKERLDILSHELLTEKSYKPKEAFMTIRVAVSGVEATPPLFDTLELLGKDETLSRLKKFY